MNNKIRKILTPAEIRANEIEAMIPYRNRKWNSDIKKEIVSSLNEFYKMGAEYSLSNIVQNSSKVAP